MLPHKHLLFGLIGGALLYYLSVISSLTEFLIFVAVSVLIDVDHFLPYVLTLNFKRIKLLIQISFGKKHEPVYQIDIFHTPEFNIVILVLAFFNKFFLIVLLSNLLHIALDVYDYYVKYRNFYILKNRCLTYKLLN